MTRVEAVERIEDFSFPGAEYLAEYNPEVNLNFMKSLSIKEIPVLVAIEQQNTLVLRGRQRIVEYLDETCGETKVMDYSGTSSVAPAEYLILPGVESQGDDACAVATDCDPVVPEEATEKE